MKLFTQSEMQTLEAAAQRSGVPLAQLMDNAGTALAKEAQARWGPLKARPVVLLCGKGNNGGDGFVCAASLADWGAACTVVLLHGRPCTGLAQEAFRQLPSSVTVLDARLQPGKAEAALSQAAVVIDCVYGFGFHGQLDDTSTRFLELANTLPCKRLSADLPSGAECDTGRVSPGCFQAQATVAFTAPKPAHYSYPAKEFCGEVLVRQVGVPQALALAASTQVQLTTGQEAVRLLPPPPDMQANKGDLGRLLLIAGSFGMAGACIMAARAALRGGVGLLHLAVDSRLYPIVAAAIPEAVFTVLDLSGDWEQPLATALKSASACVIGCGLGSLAEILCPVVFKACACPLLVDADGLNFCARSGFDLRSLAAPLAITPHPGEAARLLGTSIGEIQAERIPAAQRLAEQSGGAALLKGAATVIASPEGQVALNPTGNPGMAKGGSGDVLAGLAGALLAQGASPFGALAASAYLHGLAGDLCQESLSARAMLPTDLVEALPRAYGSLG